LGQRGGIVWLTGLSGSGKSTIAQGVVRRLFDEGLFPVMLDGDNVRHGLCGDLGFSADDRQENIRRVGELAAVMAGYGLLVVASFISPFRADRARVRGLVDDGCFVEVFVRAPLAVCEERDVKRLYAKARRGEVKSFTGIDSPYEAPEDSELVVDTAELSAEQCVDLVVGALRERGLLTADSPMKGASGS
jgi:adenylyl-sulfate kinase